MTIWLGCPFEMVKRRVAQDKPNRPLARDLKRFEQLYHERRRRTDAPIFRSGSRATIRRQPWRRFGSFRYSHDTTQAGFGDL